MTDSTRFEDRLTVALGRYADRVPVDVDPVVLVAWSRARRRCPEPGRSVAVNRLRLSLAIVVLVGLALVGVAVLGGRILVAGPAGGRLAEPLDIGRHTTPTPATSSTPVTDRLARPDDGRRPALDRAGHRDPPAVTSIWRVGEWFVAVGPESSFADDDQPVAARFIRSRDGGDVGCRARTAREDRSRDRDRGGWDVGGRQARHGRRPRGGIWTTRDGVAWQRVAASRASTSVPGESTRSHARAQGGSRSPVAGSTRVTGGLDIAIERWRRMDKGAVAERRGSRGVSLASNGDRGSSSKGRAADDRVRDLGAHVPRWDGLDGDARRSVARGPGYPDTIDAWGRYVRAWRFRHRRSEGRWRGTRARSPGCRRTASRGRRRR